MGVLSARGQRNGRKRNDKKRADFQMKVLTVRNQFSIERHIHCEEQGHSTRFLRVFVLGRTRKRKMSLPSPE